MRSLTLAILVLFTATQGPPPMPVFQSRRSTVLEYPAGLGEFCAPPAPPLMPTKNNYIEIASGDLVAKTNTTYFVTGDLDSITVPYSYGGAPVSRVLIFGGGYTAATIALSPACSDVWIDDLTLTGSTVDGLATIQCYGKRIVLKGITAVAAGSVNITTLWSHSAEDVAVVDCDFSNDLYHAQRIVCCKRFANWGGTRNSVTSQGLRIHGNGEAGNSSHDVWVSDLTTVGGLWFGFSGTNPEVLERIDARRVTVVESTALVCFKHAPSNFLLTANLQDCEFTGESAIAQLASYEGAANPNWTFSGNTAIDPTP